MEILGALTGFFLLSGAPLVSPVPAVTPAIPLVPSYSITLTGYNAVPAQTDNDPFTTASGTYSNPEVVAARSKNLADELPFGTIIEIEGPKNPQNTCGYEAVEHVIGYRVIADTMNSRYSDYIDILFSTKTTIATGTGRAKNASAVLGVCDSATIRVVGRIDLSHPNYLPKTQKELAAFVKGTLALASNSNK